jgi:hypothetical protein
MRRSERSQVPKPVVSRCINSLQKSDLLNHFVGALLELHWHVEAERLGSL